MSNEKKIYIKRGQRLTVESLQDAVTGDGYFLVTDGDGNSVAARELLTLGSAASVRFTTDESARKFKPGSLNSDLFEFIKKLVSGSREDVQRGSIGEWLDVDYISYRDLADGFGRYQGQRELFQLGPRTIGNACREMGLPIERTGSGYVVVLSEQELRAAESRFEQVTLPA